VDPHILILHVPTIASVYWWTLSALCVETVRLCEWAITGRVQRPARLHSCHYLRWHSWPGTSECCY